MKSAKAVAKTPLMQPNDEGLEFESENLAEVPPEGEAIQNAAPQERPPAREETHPSTEVIAFPSPEMDPTWEKVEVRIKKRKKLWILASLLVFLLFSSVPAG